MGVNIKKDTYLFFLAVLISNLSPGVSYGAQVLHTSDKYITNLARAGQENDSKTNAGATEPDNKRTSMRFFKNYGKLARWCSDKKKRYFTRVRSVYEKTQARVQDNYLRYVALISGVIVVGSVLRDIVRHAYNSKYVSERIAQARILYSRIGLISAIEEGEVGRVKKFIEQGASPNQRGRCDRPVLIRAIELGKLEVIEALIKAGADVNQSSVSHGWDEERPLTPLYCALMHKSSTEIIKLLLDAGAIIEAGCRYAGHTYNRPDVMKMILGKVDSAMLDTYIIDFLIYMTDRPIINIGGVRINLMRDFEPIIKLLLGGPELAFTFAKRPELLHAMAERFRDNPDLLALLFRLGAPFNQENSNNETVLGAHVRRGDIGSVRQLFELSDRKNPNNKAMYENLGLDIVGSFILHQDCVGIVQGYLLNYCDVNEMDSMGRTLLGIALTSCPMSHKELMIQLLIERDANLNRASGGALPLYLCVQMCDHRNAIRERILTSLVKAKADPNVEVDSQVGDTILHRLSGNRLGSDVCPVLKYASDLEVRNKRGRTPLLTAVEEMDSELVMYMLGDHEDEPRLSAKPVNVHATIRETGDTALHIAVSKYKALENEGDSKKKERGRAIGMAVDLMQAKASVLVKNLEGKTPLELAAGTKLYDIMQRATNGEVLIQDSDGNVI